MGKNHKKILLVRSKFTKRAWLTDVVGNRLTPKFKIVRKINLGRFVTLYTTKGTIIYHRHIPQLLYNGVGLNINSYIPRIEKLAKNIYVIKFNYNKSDLFDGNGNKLFEYGFENVINTNNNVIIVRKDGLWGMIDEDLNWIVKPSFSALSEFDVKGYCIVGLEQNSKIAVIDKSGNYILKPVCYQAAHFCNSDLLIVSNNGKHGVINLKGDVLVPAEFDLIVLKHGYFIVQENAKYGIVDLQGNIIVQCICSAINEEQDRFIIHTPIQVLELAFN